MHITIKIGNTTIDIDGTPEEVETAIVRLGIKERIERPLVPLSLLNLSVRSSMCLESIHIATVNQLIELTEQDILAARNAGKTTVKEIKEALARFKLELSI